LRFALPVGALAAAATYCTYELAISESVPLIQARTMAALVLVAVGLFALIMNSRPISPGRRLLIAAMGAIFLLILLLPSWRRFYELELPSLVMILAAVGIVGLTGAVLYGSLRSLGWLKMVPDLLRTPFEEDGAVGVLRAGVARLRTRVRRATTPVPPSD